MADRKTQSHEEYLEIVEQYRDYEAGTYKSMTVKEKMEFLDGIHTDRIPLFDEDGDDMDTSDDYYAIREEFLNHPEQFSLDDILIFLEMLDDSCYQPSFMDTVTEIIHNIVRHYRSEGAVFLLSHLHEVKESGYEFGLFATVRRLMRDDVTYQFMKDAIGLVTRDTVELVHRVVSDESGGETERKRKQELEEMISSLSV